MVKIQRYKTDKNLRERNPKGHNFVIANLKVNMQWVKEETLVLYKGYELIILPASEDFYPGVCTILNQKVEGEPVFNYERAQTIISNFLSALCWHNDSYIIIQGFSSGNHPSRFADRKEYVDITDIHFFDEIPQTDDPAKLLSLALYREAKGLNNPAFKFLSYYKIINVFYRSGKEQKHWIQDNIDKLTHRAKERLDELKKSERDVAKYLYQSGRCAIAHSYMGADQVANPDDYADYKRLTLDMPIISQLARIFIEEKFNVKTWETLFDEHLYELKGFKSYFKKEKIKGIIEEKEIKISEFPALPNLSIRLRGKPKFNLLENLKARVIEIKNGAAYVSCSSDEKSFETILFLNFKEERLQSDFFSECFFGDDKTAESCERLAEFLEFRKHYFGNGILEVWASEYELLLGRCNAFIPVNWQVDIEKANEEIEYYRNMAEESKNTAMIPPNS